MSIRDERKLQSQQCIMETVLVMGYAGQNFSHLSLRQLAREVGIVPSALYRYFQNKEALASALIDQVALVIKGDLNLIVDCFIQQPSETSQLKKFLLHAEQQATYWHFFIAERWGGFSVLQDKIEQEIEDLTDNLTRKLTRQSGLPAIYHQQEHVLAAMLLPLFFTWIIRWLQLKRAEMTQDQEQDFLAQFQAQMMLLIHE